jgi:hypothetical protein
MRQKGTEHLGVRRWSRVWRIGMVLLGALGTAAITADQVDWPPNWWIVGHNKHPHTDIVIAALGASAFAAIAVGVGQELSESRRQKSLAVRTRIEEVLGAILANIVDYSTQNFSKRLGIVGSNLQLRISPPDPVAELQSLVSERIPSITKMAAYYYHFRRRFWRGALLRRGRFSIGTGRPEQLQVRYRVGQGGIGTAGKDEIVTWQSLRMPDGTTAILVNTPIFSDGSLIGILSIVAEPGDREMEDCLLDKAMTDQLAGWRTALAKVVERGPE